MRAALTLAAALSVLAACCQPARAEGFGFLPGDEGFEAVARADGGAPATLAGSHPNALTFKLGFQLAGEFPAGDPRDLGISLPPGLIANPQALPQCTAEQLNSPRSSPFEASASGESCPDATQVGTVDLRSRGATRRFGLFNLVPPPGVPAELGFAPYGAPIALRVALRPAADGTYVTSLEAGNLTQAFPIEGLDIAVWGIPWGPSHDGERGDCLNEAEPAFPWAKCSVGESSLHASQAFLTMPTACGDPLAFSATAASWQGERVSRDFESPGSAQQDCATLAFEPQAFGQLTNDRASSATGFRFILRGPDEGLTAPARRTASEPRRAVVSLPEGVVVNPSVGAGLESCTAAQYAAETPGGGGCPATAKIGDFNARSPLFEKQLDGGIYLAQPDDPRTTATGAENPFDSTVAVYLIARSFERGVLIKVAGELAADPSSGNLTATFDHLPQLPYTELEVNFRSGQRAPLVTPPRCGTATTRLELIPWSSEVKSLRQSAESKIQSGIGGGPCPSGGTPPFAPGAVAGGVNSNVGSYTPYFVHLTRRDTEQEITSYSMVLPRGIVAKLAGIPFCPDAAIAAARLRLGNEELSNPSCPAASRVGRTITGYGVGAALTYARGNIYLAGPYHGQPLSLVTINAATVGPFDLGTIVIRSAFEIDPATAQLRIDSRSSDPIPHIIDGIPLALRDIRIYIDRPQFTRNPTSCEASQLSSTLTGSGTSFGDSSDDSSASATVPFQLLNCLTLDFRPKLGLRLGGGSRRGDYPALRAVFRARSGDANLKRMAVTMPHSEFLAQNHIRTICTRAQFGGGDCPPGSVYGSATALTPLFDEPLRGPVVLRSSTQKLPDLVADLHSGAVRIVLAGRIGPAKHGIRAFFDDLPDAPINRFVLHLRGGGRGLLVNSSNICASPPQATVTALAQNNRGAVFKTELRGNCPRRPSR